MHSIANKYLFLNQRRELYKPRRGMCRPRLGLYSSRHGL